MLCDCLWLLMMPQAGICLPDVDPGVEGVLGVYKLTVTQTAAPGRRATT